MISYLNGIVLKKLEKSIIVKTGDIGYEIKVSTNQLNNLHEDDNLEFFIHTHVREDDISLYGFDTLEQLIFFKKLISVSGIGPKTGLEVLNLPVPELKKAIFEKNYNYFKKIKGIGKKTIERMFLDLKILPEDIDSVVFTQEKREVNDDIIGAITNLGYSRAQINSVLKNIPEEVKEDEEIIKYFLQNL